MCYVSVFVYVSVQHATTIYKEVLLRKLAGDKPVEIYMDVTGGEKGFLASKVGKGDKLVMFAGPWVGVFKAVDVMGGCSSVREALDWKGHTKCVPADWGMERSICWYYSLFTKLEPDLEKALQWDRENGGKGEKHFFAWEDEVDSYYISVGRERFAWDMRSPSWIS